MRVEALAKSLGVTKGGFYGSFTDRDALLAFCLAIGEHFLAADHDGRSRSQVLFRAADILLNRSDAAPA